MLFFVPRSPINLNYKQYDPKPVPIEVIFSVPAGTSFIDVRGLPDWLSVINPSIENGNLGRIFIDINPPGANLLSGGRHTATLTVTTLTFGQGSGISESGDYTVNIDIVPSKPLQVSPTVLSFNYNTASAVPADKTVQVTAEGNWAISKSESWLTTSTTNGNQNASFKIGVSPVTLATGNYSGTVTVTDGKVNRKINVSLTVTGAATPQSYLYLNPENLEFISQQGVANAVSKTLIIDVGSPWGASASENWLQIGTLSGASGIHEVAITVNSTTLATGIHQAVITVTANGIIKKSYVILRVIELSLSGFLNNGLYYSGDRNQVIASNINDNSFLLLQVEASTENETKNFPLSQPYFKGTAKALVGIETEYLLPSVKPPENLVTGITNPVRPIVLNIDAFEEDRFTGVSINLGTYTNVNFLRGRTPKIQGRASYVPYQIFVSSKAIVQLTTVSFTAPDKITITGAITATINGNLANGLYLYTGTIALSDFDLTNGDELDIVFGSQAMKVVINDEYTELVTLAFENEWGTYELFETRGFITDSPNVEQTISTRAVEGKEESRIIKTDSNGEFELNTGYISSRQEIEWLAKALESKRFFLYIDGERIEVILLTKSLQVYETRKHINAYRLKFKRAMV